MQEALLPTSAAQPAEPAERGAFGRPGRSERTAKSPQSGARSGSEYGTESETQPGGKSGAKPGAKLETKPGKGAPEPAADRPIARVMVDTPLPHLDRPFDYLVPAGMAEQAVPGSRIRVRFAGKLTDGFLLERSDTTEHTGRLAFLDRVVSPEPVLAPEIAALARAVADRYAGSMSDVLRLAIPPRHARTESASTQAPSTQAASARSSSVEPSSVESSSAGLSAADPSSAEPPSGELTPAGASSAKRPPAALAAAGPAAQTVAGPGGSAWDGYPAGAAFLTALREGRAPRAIWMALPGTDAAGITWVRAVAEAVRATLEGGRGALVVVPDGKDVALLDAALTEALSADLARGGPLGARHAEAGQQEHRAANWEHVALTADLGPAERYRRWLRVSRGQARAVVGTRGAAFAPVAGLGLAVIWDDGDDLHAEKLAPYPHAREVLALRAQTSGCGLLVGGYARTAEATRMIATGWARPLVPAREVIRARQPRVRPAGDDAEQARDEAARAARLPSLAWRALKQGLEGGLRSGAKDVQRDGPKGGQRDGLKDGLRGGLKGGQRDGLKDGLRGELNDGLRGELRGGLESGLASGPVLVQVPRRGYLPAIACLNCRAPARCTAPAGSLAVVGTGPSGTGTSGAGTSGDAAEGAGVGVAGGAAAGGMVAGVGGMAGVCGGPLALRSGHAMPYCRWCGRIAGDWRCGSCGSNRVRALVVGARRTAEELGRAFPSVRVKTSGRDGVLATVGPAPALVVATPGAEPVAEGGYAAAVLLDGWALLGRPDLRSAEEALRRWMNAAALLRPGAELIVMADSAAPVVQALIRWDPVTFAERELRERQELGFPPAIRIATLTGPPSGVRETLETLDLPPAAQVLGPVDMGEGNERAMIRVPPAFGPELARVLKGASGVRSARKAGDLVRIVMDPLDLI
ncbi:primosomal protein N' [Streptosporangiaceae bacterium NEAU-GS5]|nr:primosomal protein N' [Streptosporangiaceae bacterium NEAU-GS5]